MYLFEKSFAALFGRSANLLSYHGHTKETKAIFKNNKNNDTLKKQS